MNVEKQYNKEIIEPFAINTIARSFAQKYSEYSSPTDTNNFDFISKDGTCALEVTLVIPENERREHIYEVEKSKGKNNLKTNHIKNLKLDSSGKVLSYYGGSIGEIIKSIKNSIEKKQKKASRRNITNKYKAIDLCICIQDGGLLDIRSFEWELTNLDSYIFDNIFFITSSCFIRYCKGTGFQEHTRII